MLATAWGQCLWQHYFPLCAQEGGACGITLPTVQNTSTATQRTNKSRKVSGPSRDCTLQSRILCALEPLERSLRRATNLSWRTIRTTGGFKEATVHTTEGIISIPVAMKAPFAVSPRSTGHPVYTQYSSPCHSRNQGRTCPCICGHPQYPLHCHPDPQFF